MREPFDATTIIFALLAIFVLWKLRSVLGSRTGQEKPPTNPFARRSSVPPPTGANDDKIVRLPGAAEERRPVPPRPPSANRWAGFAEAGSRLAAGFEAIAAADARFDPAAFVAGARTAYEMIVLAYADGNRDTLRKLLADDVYESFAASIAQREARQQRLETTLVSIDAVTFDDAVLRGRTAQLTLRFNAKLITATHDSAGAVVEGNPDKVVDMIDVWTFARNVDSRDPNWQLVATQTGH